jgi:hypothetical protein
LREKDNKYNRAEIIVQKLTKVVRKIHIFTSKRCASTREIELKEEEELTCTGFI